MITCELDVTSDDRAAELLPGPIGEAAFVAFYRNHYLSLLRFCQYRLGDRHEAEDAAQEAFVRAWRTMSSEWGDASRYAWVKVVAGNLCTDVQRRRWRCQPAEEIDVSAHDGGMDRFDREAEKAMVRAALGRLNDRHRDALLMRESEGLTYDQIALRTGTSAGTVESLLWRARQALKREISVLAGGEGAWGLVPAVDPGAKVVSEVVPRG